MTIVERQRLATWNVRMPRERRPAQGSRRSQPPNTPKPPRRAAGWLLLAAGVCVVVAGTATGHGLVMAGGFVLAVAAMYLLDVDRRS